MKNTSIMMLHHFISRAYYYLKDSIDFNKEGWPIFSKDMFLDEWPNYVVPYSHKNSKYIHDNKKTVLCFYSSDIEILPRFEKLLNEISIYKKYLGVVIPDLSVTPDMDYEMQSFIMLANQLFGAVLAVNGIKIIFNTRVGNNETISLLRNIPIGVMCSSGFLGCYNSKSEYESSQYIDKILSLLPSKLLIYGKKDEPTLTLLGNLGINYRRYDDFHTFSKKGGYDGL